MKRLSISFLLTITLLSGVGSQGLAQSADELRAGALLQTAERLKENDGTIDEVSAAFEQALNAYTKLGDADTSIDILQTLIWLNYSDNCRRDKQAITWAEKIVNLLAQPIPKPDSESEVPISELGTVPYGEQTSYSELLEERLSSYAYWARALGALYWHTDQIAAAISTFAAGADHLAGQPQSFIVNTTILDDEAELLRSQLTLETGTAASQTQQRLLAVRQRKAAITLVDGLLEDAKFLNSEGTPSLELLQLILDTSQQHQYQAGEANALMLFAKQALHVEDFVLASEYARSAMTIAEQLLDNQGPWTSALYLLAQAEDRSGNSNVAIEHYTQLLEILNARPTLDTEAYQPTIVSNLIKLHEQNNQFEIANRLARDYDPGFIPIRRRAFRNPYRATFRTNYTRSLREHPLGVRFCQDPAAINIRDDSDV